MLYNFLPRLHQPPGEPIHITEDPTSSNCGEVGDTTMALALAFVEIVLERKYMRSGWGTGRSFIPCLRKAWQ